MEHQGVGFGFTPGGRLLYFTTITESVMTLIVLVCMVSSLTFRKGSDRDAPRLFGKKHENNGFEGGGKARPLTQPLKQYQRSSYE